MSSDFQTLTTSLGINVNVIHVVMNTRDSINNFVHWSQIATPNPG